MSGVARDRSRTAAGCGPQHRIPEEINTSLFSRWFYQKTGTSGNRLKHGTVAGVVPAQALVSSGFHLSLSVMQTVEAATMDGWVADRGAGLVSYIRECVS